MTKTESADLCDTLQTLYPNAKLTERSPNAYWLILRDCPYWILTESLPAIVRVQPKFCPTPGELYMFVTCDRSERPNPIDLPRLIKEGICTPEGTWT